MPVVGTRNDQEDFVSAGAVFRAQPVHGRAQAAGAGSVEVGNLNDSHTVRESRAHVRSTIPDPRTPEQSVNCSGGS